MKPLPSLQGNPGAQQLFIDGKASLLLGGQVHNSSTSSEAAIEASFAKAAKLNYNFVIGPVSWQQSEPEEGRYNFDLVAKQIEVATGYNLHLALIWFGAFKNAGSTYAPRWIRADVQRFERSMTSPSATSTGNPVLSVFNKELLEADASAFEALMKFLRDNDPNHRVVMVQVENEVGLLGGSRDYSPTAEALWNSQVPQTLVDSLSSAALPQDVVLLELLSRASNSSGSWESVFGGDWKAHELFMAWGFASYVNELARRGKAIKSLPMFVNAWLGPQPGQSEAGQWPSGGPSLNTLPVYKAVAQSIDLLTPDIYVKEALPVMADYSRPDNTLFIPESRHSTGNVFWAIGQHKAIGYSVFGAEDGRIGNQLSECYLVLNAASGEILAAQATNSINAVILDETKTEITFEIARTAITAKNSLLNLRRFIEFAGVDLEINLPEPTSELESLAVTIPSSRDDRAFGLVIKRSDDEFLVIGKGLNFSFAADSRVIEIDEIVEGHFEEGKWQLLRDLNGDERLNHLPLLQIGCSSIRLLRHSSH